MAPPKSANKCAVSGCDKKYDSHGYCGMHRQRFVRYGDPLYITPEEERIKRLRNAQPTLNKCQPHVYKKLFGKHEHRRVMEEKIGRELTRWEIVYHIDGDKHNNNSDNLQLITQKEHIKIHRQEMMYAQQQRAAEKRALKCT